MALTKQQMEQMTGRAGALTSIGAGIGSLFGGNKNPADAANKYLDRIPGETAQYYDPYIQQGQDMMHQTGDQYGQLMNDPGSKLNDIGSHYQQSPGFKFALQQALQGSGNAAAAGGMAGSPQHEQQNIALATDYANQDYNKWLEQATGLYGEGLHGGQEQSNQGQSAAQSRAELIAQQLAQQAQLNYAGQASKNASNPFGNILGGIGSLLAFK
jgi:hypothetical protein